MILISYLISLSLSIEIVQREKPDGRKLINVNWTNDVPDFPTFRVFRSVNNKDFQSISNIDLERGEQVRVLNIFPKTDRNSTFKRNDGTVIRNTYTSAALKVYMEGGFIDNTKLDPIGSINLATGTKQLIFVDMIDFPSYHKNPKVIWNYDVIMFGSWDYFPPLFQPPGINMNTPEEVEDIRKYIEAGWGVLIGHDGLAPLNDNLLGLGLIPLRDLLKVKLGILNPDRLTFDVPAQTTYLSSKVKMTKEGILTQYPWSLGKIGTILTIPVTHSSSQFTTSDVWFELTEGEYTSKTNTPLNRVWEYGNPIAYLTSNNNIAMIQTGHSNGASSVDERKMLANTLFYLKQRSGNKYVDDNDVFDVGPKIPQLRNVEYKGGTRATIFLMAEYLGTRFDYQIKGYDAQNNLQYTSPNVTTFVRSDTRQFKYTINQNPNANVNELTMSLNAPTKDDTDDDFLDFTIQTEEFLHNQDQYLHIIVLDDDGHSSEVAHLKISSIPAPSPTPEATPEPSSTPRPTFSPNLIPETSEEEISFADGTVNDSKQKKNNNLLYYIIGGVAGGVAVVSAVTALILKLRKQPTAMTTDAAEFTPTPENNPKSTLNIDLTGKADDDQWL